MQGTDLLSHTTLLLAAATIVGTIAYSITGFGLAVLLMVAYPFFINIVDANILINLIGVVITPILLIHHLRDLRLSILGKVIIGSLAGIPVGVWGLLWLDSRVLMIIVGCFIILYLSYDLFIKRSPAIEAKPYLSYIAGFVSGACIGAFTAGGPVAVAYLASLRITKEQLKGNILAFILFVSIYRLIFLVYHSLVTTELLIVSSVLLIPAVVGLLIGRILYKRLPDLYFRRAIKGLLFVSAVLMIITKPGA